MPAADADLRKPAAAASAAGSSQNGPPEHGIIKTEVWSLADFMQHVEDGGGGGGAASSSSVANSVGCLDPKPKTLVVVHGLHPGYSIARKLLHKETLNLMLQALATATATCTALAYQPPPPQPPSDLPLPPRASPTPCILSDAPPVAYP